MKIKSSAERVNDLVEKLSVIDGVEVVDVDVKHARAKITVEGVPVNISAGYGGRTFEGSSILFVRISHWKDEASAITSIKSKIASIRREAEREREKSLHAEQMETFEARVMARLEESYGGRSGCIAGPYGRRKEFTSKLHFDEDQVVEFMEHNKDFIDENGKWKGKKK